jgi:hypothetical protein
MSEEIENRLRAVESHLTTHEAVCAERYSGIILNQTDIRSDLKATKTLLINIGLALLGGMALIMAKLVFHT